MAINKNSNGYTFFFAIAMVVVVGTTLAVTAFGLKPLQQKNQATKKMMDILGAVKVDADRSNAAALFTEYVTRRVAVNYNGEVISEKPGDAEVDPTDKNDPFNIDVKKDYKANVKKFVQQFGDNEEKLASALEEAGVVFPVFEVVKDGEKFFVCPMVGTGLWGPIWGYVSLEEDYKTIYGARFDHKAETPGLGAEIKEDFFQVKFEGKQLQLADGSDLFNVLKGGAQTNEHSVDGITGGTITSKGVDEMLNRTLPVYLNYFENANNQRAQR